MGIRLVYGLKTRDESWLDGFYPSRRIAEAIRAHEAAHQSEPPLDYRAMLFPPGSPAEPVIEACLGHVVLLRGELPRELYDALESAGVRTVNRGAPVALARDKLRSAEFFRELGVPHPRTVEIDPSPGKPEPPLPYPFVAKPRFGKMGRGVELIHDARDWAEWLSGGHGEGLAQEQVTASEGRDLRFFFARWPGSASVTAVCVTREGGGFLSNAHAGAHMRAFTPSASLAAESARVFSCSGLDYGTVDWLFADPEGSSFSACELNSCPGFEELERATGLDAAGAIVATLVAILGKEPS